MDDAWNTPPERSPAGWVALRFIGRAALVAVVYAVVCTQLDKSHSPFGFPTLTIASLCVLWGLGCYLRGLEFDGQPLLRLPVDEGFRHYVIASFAIPIVDLGYRMLVPIAVY